LIKALLIDPKTGTVEAGDSSLLEAWQGSEKLLWLDIYNAQGNEEQSLFERMEIHPIAVADATRKRHPPKIESFENFDLIMMRGLDASFSGEGLEFKAIQLAMFVGENWIVTRHQSTSTSINYMWERLASGKDLPLTGAGIAVGIANRLARRYVEMLLEFEPRLEEIEEEMFEKPDDVLLAELTSHKSRLREIIRIARYHHIVTEQLLETEKSGGGAYQHEASSLVEQVDRTGSLAAMYYDTSKDLTDSYLALASHNLNRVMQVLTVITVIFVPLTFIAGIYGMNFEYIPELGFRWGYFVVIGVMLTLAIGLLVVFKRKHWF
jgi:magnesium transporter